MTDKLEALKALADEIAPGYRQKWGCEDGINGDSISVGTYNDDGDICPFIEVSISDWSGNDDDNEKLSKFITLANPPVVSDLLAALEEANKRAELESVGADKSAVNAVEWMKRANAAEQREEHLKATVDVLSAKNAELERANAAQDDHINQQQDRIDTLENRNGELGKHVCKLEKLLKGTEESLIASVDNVAELEQRLQQPIKLPKREIGMACEFVSDHIVVSLEAVLAEAATAGFKAEVEVEGE